MMMLRPILLACCLLAVTSATTDSGNLLTLLKKLLDQEEKRVSTGSCQNANCNGGKCNDLEDPFGMGFYCVRCPGKFGGLTCDVKDPCDTNPCPNADDTCYGPVSMDPSGRYCWATRNADLVNRLQRKLDTEDLTPSQLEGLLKHIGSSDFDESLTALRRVLE